MTRTTATLLTIFFLILGNFLAFKYIDSNAKLQVDLSNKIILNESKQEFNNLKNIITWNSEHNELFTKDNKVFKKVDHTWLTKQIIENSNNKDYYFKLTSLNLLNPNNKPDKFEYQALNRFENEDSDEYHAFSSNLKRFNYIKALKAQASCVECHNTKEYMVGDNIGAIRITIQTSKYKDFYDELVENTRVTKVTLVIVSILFLLIIVWFFNGIFKKSTFTQKQAEDLLNETQKNLSKVEKMTQSAFWSLEIKSMKLTVSENIRHIFGLEKDAPFGMKELFKTFVYEEDREFVSSSLTHNVAQRTSFSIQYRFKRFNEDEIRYLNCRIEHKIVDGKIINTFATIQDITDINIEEV